jgi:hypothetical protein
VGVFTCGDFNVCVCEGDCNVGVCMDGWSDNNVAVFNV